MGWHTRHASTSSGLEGHLRPETLNLTAWNHALGLLSLSLFFKSIYNIHIYGNMYVSIYLLEIYIYIYIYIGVCVCAMVAQDMYIYICIRAHASHICIYMRASPCA